MVARRSILLGMGLALAQLLTLLGVLLLAAWSYAIWGSENSPLAELLWPALVVLALGAAIRMSLQFSIQWTRRVRLLHRRRHRVRERVRQSKIEIAKLK